MIARPSPQRLAADERLLDDALDALERAECTFWACTGPRARDIDCVTCCVCSTIARLRRRLGRPVRDGIEGQFPIGQEELRRDLARATAGPSPDGCTTITWRA